MEPAEFHIYARVFEADVCHEECSVRAGAKHGLTIDRKHTPRRRIVGALTEWLEFQQVCRVTIIRRRLPGIFSAYTIEVPTREEGIELVRALGLASDQRALEVALGHQTTVVDLVCWLTALFAPMAIAGLLALTSGWSWFLPIVMSIGGALLYCALPLTLLAYAFLFRIRVVVGIDGVTMRTWRKRAHVPFDRIDAVERSRFGALLHLKDGRVVKLFEHMTANQRVTLGEILFRRIWQMQFASSDLCRKTSTLDDVRHVGAKEWVRSLRENPESRPVSYRVPARQLPAIDEAILDVTQPVEVRVAAAIAMRAKEGAAATDRIRAAASASASPQLRVLFEKIAEEASEEEVARRIEQLA